MDRVEWSLVAINLLVGAGGAWILSKKDWEIEAATVWMAERILARAEPSGR